MMRFLLIDKIIELERNRRIVGIKNVAMSEDFLTEHFPKYPVMPGALIVEGMIQLSSWLIAVSTDFRYKGMIQTLNQAKFKGIIRPGDQLLIEVESINEEMNHFSCKASLDGKIVVTAKFEVKFVKLDKFETPQSAKSLFSVLWRK